MANVPISMLIQKMERELPLGQKVASKRQTANCKLSQLVQAECKCKECGQLFCGGCRLKHDLLKKFQDHTMQSLCEKHADGISHTCMKCYQEICGQCIIMEHGEHEDEVVNYAEGMIKIKEDLDQLGETLKYNMDKFQGKAQELDETRMKVSMEISELGQQIESKMRKMGELQRSAWENGQQSALLQKQQTYLGSLYDSITRAQEGDGQMMQKYKQIQQIASQFNLDIPPPKRPVCGRETWLRCRYCNKNICASCRLKYASADHTLDNNKLFGGPCVGSAGLSCRPTSMRPDSQAEGEIRRPERRK